MAQEPGIVRNAPAAFTQGGQQFVSLNAYGAMVVVDFWTQLALDGRCFQVKWGTITTPLVGPTAIADTAAEGCVDSPSNALIILPAELSVAIRLGTGTLHEHALKSRTGSNSSAGTAFTPLPLLASAGVNSGSVPVASTTARVQATGNVTVPAETATTTLRHYEWSQPIAAGAFTTSFLWTPKTPAPVRNGCLYYQNGAASTGNSYYAHLNYAEVSASQIGL